MADTLVQFLREGADKYGSRTALLFKPGFRYQRWSYAQLWDEAGRVAALLQQRGLKKGDRATIWGPNCPQWVLAFFGCMRAGVVAVPLDLRSPSDFVERVVAKTRPAVAFVSRVTPQAHQQLNMSKVYFEDMDALLSAVAASNDVPVTASDLAEVMFTSGTTGDPKGVMITHANLIANLEAANQYIPGHPSYRLLSILPLSHMFEQMACLLMALRCGANITYPTSRQPTVLFRTMRERRVTTLLLVPQALDLFMKGIEREVRRQGKERAWSFLMRIARYTPFRMRRLLFRPVHRRFGGCLDFITSGGAALDPELGAKWELLGVKVIQGYGATEASPVISCHKLKSPRFDSVGLPLPGVDVRISEEGEVLVRGPNIFPGYWEAPEQTASAIDGGWYKTGDLGFFDDRGFLHLKGRKKDMIVLANGQNVFPEDIEGVLKKHPAVTDAVVVGLPKRAEVEVHAAIILNDAAAAPGVVTWANAQLADHQRVHGYTVWPDQDFPRTHTLKVKKSLVVDALNGAFPPAASAATQAGSPAATPTLPSLLAEVSELPLEQLADEKTLGGELNLDSLRRVELLSTIEEELGVYLDETQVGPDTTVGQLAAMVEQGSRTELAPSFPTWGRSWWCGGLRGAIQRTVIFPIAAFSYRLRVAGRENLNGLQGPVLFAANHNLWLDNALIIKAMPLRWRRRLAIAAAAELWRSPAWAVLNPLLGNGFPFSREGAVRASLDNLGRVLDEGWSVLIYPEGKLTVGGPIQPFMSGIGLVGVGANVPVVPVRLHIRRAGSPRDLPIWRRGQIEVRLGQPISFSPGASYLETTQTIERAIKAL